MYLERYGKMDNDQTRREGWEWLQERSPLFGGIRFLRRRELVDENGVELDGGRALSPYTIIDGKMASTQRALEKITGEAFEELSCYPEAIQPFLGRRVGQATLGTAWEVARDLGIMRPMVKSIGTKRTTVEILPTQEECELLLNSGRFNADLPLWVTEEVRFAAEYRFFIALDSVLGWTCYLYDGGGIVFPNPEEVYKVISAYAESGTAPWGYVLDIGLTEKGPGELEQVVIEVNDVLWSGTWGLSMSQARSLSLFARWLEISMGREKGREVLKNLYSK